MIIIDLLPTETPKNHPVASDSVFNSFHVRVLDKAYDGILGLELRHKDTDTRHVYVLSPTRKFSVGTGCGLFFSHLLTQIYRNYGMDSIVLFGDFNARVGKVNV